MPGEESVSLQFSRAMRLTQARDFARLKAQGRRQVKGCLILNWMPQDESPVSRAGFITSRKLGHAVVRTRARRLLRETFRLHQHKLKRKVDLVLIARASIVGKKRLEVERDFLAALQQANLLKSPQ
jgi:ribonuclease P protein component